MDRISEFSRFHHSRPTRHLRADSPRHKTLRCTSTPDLIAAAPYMMGFTVTNSLVVLLLNRTNGSLGALRFQLPTHAMTPAEHRDHAELLAGMIEPLKQVTEVALLVYPPAGTVRAAALPQAELVWACAKRLHDLGRHIIDAVCVTDTTWAYYFTPEQNPEDGFPMSEVRQRPIALECATTVSSPIRDFDTASELPGVDPDLVSAVHARCVRRSEKPRERAAVGFDPWQAWHTMERLHTLATFPRSTPNPNQLAKLIGELQREEHWVNAAALLSGGWDVWDHEFTNIVRQRRMTLREFLFVDQTGEKLMAAPFRQTFLEVPLYEWGKRQPQRDEHRDLMELFAFLTAVTPPRLRPSVAALWAYGWWIQALPSLATRTLSRWALPAAPPVTLTRVSLPRGVNSLLGHAPQPEWSLAHGRELPDAESHGAESHGADGCRSTAEHPEETRSSTAAHLDGAGETAERHDGAGDAAEP